MDDFRDQKSADDRPIEDADRTNRDLSGDNATSNESSSCAGSSMNPSIGRRLTQILVEDGDEDLLLQRSDMADGFLPWLRALDFQVMGACRADERLKPFLKLNVSTGMAEDCLLSHLSQHFEPSEVGILARCLCIPLVSIRVGKINKSGTILCPTSIRGNLCLILLPTSDLRISFNGDDGSTERLITFSRVQHTVEIEEIPADVSGRSFLIKISDSVMYYFWCSEKSKLLGDELLKNMKDLLVKKPSLAELTGISESRLNCFASHLRSYLSGSMVTNTQIGGALPVTSSSDNSVNLSGIQSSQSSFTCQKNSRFRHYTSQGAKTNLTYQGSLSPKSSSFKEGLPKNLISTRSAAREKLKRRVENYAACVDSLALASTSKCDRSSSDFFDKDRLSELNGRHPFAESSLLDALGKSTELPFSVSEIQFPSSSSSHLSPHYCWCPPVASGLQCTVGNSQLPVSSVESPLLPPLSSLLSGTRQSKLFASKPSLSMSELPPFDFPFSPESLVRLPTSQQIPTFTPRICAPPFDFPFLPEALVRLPSSQQIPTFTPLICDPIVHIPVIDVCSSGQGYLVSAGPALSTTIPPRNSNLVDTLPETESVLEKGARETLRMLIRTSNQTNSQLLDVFPSVLNRSGDKQNVLSTSGSRGIYSGTIDVDVLTQSLKTMGLVLLSKKQMGSGIGKLSERDDLYDQEEKPSSSDTSSFNEGID